MILAQVIAGFDVVHLALAIVVIAGIVALVAIGLRKLGITIPDWIVQVFWVVVAVVVICAAIKVVASMW